VSAARLTILIPTIAERAAWLGECLDSILPLPDACRAEVIVSGNGTGAETRRVCHERRVRLIEHPVRMTASQHGRAILAMDVGEWTWSVADDDLVAPGAVSQVLEYLELHGPDVIVGRTRRFVRPDLSDLSVPVPSHRSFAVARDIRRVAESTRMRIDLGAFVFRSGLFSIEMYNRYAGTSHDGFGALWDGIDALPDPKVVITPVVLVFARQDKKAHDESAWRTWLGMLSVAELLPESIRDIAIETSDGVVSYRPVLRAIAEGENPTRHDIPSSIWRQTRWTRKCTFVLATRCPSSVARLALKARTKFPSLSHARGAEIAPPTAERPEFNSNDEA